MDTDSVQYSYPIEEIRNCIIVPLEEELPKYYYVVWPFGRWIWVLMVLGVFYIAYLMRMLSRSPKATTKSFQLNVLYSIALILYTSNINVPSLNTSTQSMLLPSLVRVVNRLNFQRLLKSRDRSFAYVLAQDQWNYLNRQQSQLVQPYFHLSHICFNKSHQGFPMQVESSLNRSFNNLLFHLVESDLWRQWEEEAFRMAAPVEALGLEFFKFGWFVLAVGLPLSCSTMLIELFMGRKY